MRHVSETKSPASKGERTRRAILEAAIARFGRDGFRGTSVTDIARDAGVGGTVAYAYFPNKEALFLAAADEDAAGVIEASLANTIEEPHLPSWPINALATAIASLDHHPLARRLLTGQEPEHMAVMADSPAIVEVRKNLAERLRNEQAAGLVRSDVDAVSTANGLISIMLALLLSVVQVGEGINLEYTEDVAGVLHASIVGLRA